MFFGACVRCTELNVKMLAEAAAAPATVTTMTMMMMTTTTDVRDDIKFMERAHPKSERSREEKKKQCLFPIKYANRKHTLTQNPKQILFSWIFSQICLVYQNLICIGNWCSLAAHFSFFISFYFVLYCFFFIFIFDSGPMYDHGKREQIKSTDKLNLFIITNYAECVCWT